MDGQLSECFIVSIRVAEPVVNSSRKTLRVDLSNNFHTSVEIMENNMQGITRALYDTANLLHDTFR